MNFSSNNKSQNIFVEKNKSYDNNSSDSSKRNIILSPEFYWTRKFDIPVKNKTEALKIVPTLFEDILPDDENFDYYIYLLQDKTYICFAYNSEKITENLKALGINILQIDSIRFAQSEFMQFDNFSIGEQNYTYKDNILIKLPKNIPVSFQSIDEKIKNLSLSQHKINIKFYSNLINQKYINVLLTILVIVSLVNIFKIIDTSSSTSIMEKNIETLTQNSNFPATLIQTKSIISTMNRKFDTQSKVRDAIDYILSYKSATNKGKIQSIDYANNRFKIVFSDVDYNSVKSYISKKYSILSDKAMANTLNMEIGI